MGKPSSSIPRDPKVGFPNIKVPRVLAAISAALALVLYILTCSPSVSFTDSGELITVAWVGGIAHPPGYPLYSLIGSVFTQLPFGNPAWRMNVLSTLFAALAVGIFCALVTTTLIGMPAFRQAVAPRSLRSQRSAVPRTSSSGKSTRAAAASSSSTSNKGTGASKSTTGGKSHIIGEHSQALKRTAADSTSEVEERVSLWAAVSGGLAAAGLLAVSLTFWNWATQAKFYSLHYAFVAALLWLVLRTRRGLVSDVTTDSAIAPRWALTAWPSSIRLLHLLAFATGLSLTNHFLTFLLLPGIIVLLLSPLRYARTVTRRVLRHAGTLVLAGAIPLLIYLYLPLRAAAQPLIAWGLPYTWDNFWRHVTAQGYQSFFGATDLDNHMVDAIIYAANQFGPWLGAALLVPIVAGLVYLWRTDRGLLAATTVIALTDVVVVLNYNIREIVTYYVPLYMVALWWAGLGISQSIVWLVRRLSVSNTSSTWIGSRSPVVTLAMGVVLPLIGLVINWGAAGHRDNYTAELFVRNAFQNFRPNAVVLTNYWDLTSTSFYLQYVLNERRDVVVIDKSVLRQPFYLDYLERNYPELVNKNAGPVAEYKTLLHEWADTGRTPAGLPTAYVNVLNGFIDTNLGQRPVYTYFVVEANDQQEAQEALALLDKRRSQLVPDGMGYRIAVGADDLRTQDPRLDLRGVVSQKVPLDEIEASVIALYPTVMRNIGTHLQKSSIREDKDVGARLLTQAQELQSFAELLDARPRLR